QSPPRPWRTCPCTITPHFRETGLIGDGCRPQIGLTSARVSAHRNREAPAGSPPIVLTRQERRIFRLKKRCILPIAYGFRCPHAVLARTGAAAYAASGAIRS